MVAQQHSFAGSVGRGCLLVADHEEEVRRGFDSLFRSEGYETFLAADDTEAVEIVRREWIDVVVLELELPRTGGLGVLRVIRQVSRAGLPCVLTAVEVSGRVQVDALAEDALTVIPKPVDASLLKRVVASVLRRSHFY
jgi:two-component system response regulator (stage 0 sporulation protein F)